MTRFRHPKERFSLKLLKS